MLRVCLKTSQYQQVIPNNYFQQYQKIQLDLTQVEVVDLEVEVDSSYLMLILTLVVDRVVVIYLDLLTLMISIQLNH